MSVVEQVRYLEPGWFTTKIFNRVVHGLTRAGLSVAGSRILRVRGRTSGEWRENPVNVLGLDGVRYLIAPRGATQWVRNLRVGGGGELRVGRRTEAFTADELPDEVKLPILREYLRKWGWEVGQFFDGITTASTDAELAAIAPGFPVFRLR
ncbi:nitroreductase/quinone reductase family protein [Cryptosporangium arvum]|uniref:nitroreductase/quinone reductase family protein n=1 Tax=Cryptosporangium arvum TaxID=80871 RepID=UPI0004AC7FE8|nr:nitroreductase/quinone reductase family protein [Cryptosporangium arvum]